MNKNSFGTVTWPQINIGDSHLIPKLQGVPVFRKWLYHVVWWEEEGRRYKNLRVSEHACSGRALTGVQQRHPLEIQSRAVDALSGLRMSHGGSSPGLLALVLDIQWALGPRLHGDHGLFGANWGQKVLLTQEVKWKLDQEAADLF